MSRETPGLICLGASAGGLRSLEAVLSRLPADLPWPVFISQHLQPDRPSQMAEILQRVATLRVVEAEDGATPEPGTVYACPSELEMGITPEGRIILRPPVAGKPQRIDHLFATASAARPGRVVAVVLSGTGTDGAVGALVVKLSGGMVIVESEESAQYVGMPSAALRAGAVDASLRASDVAALVARLAQGSLDEASAATSAILREITRALAADSGTDFTHYREGTLRRRAQARRAILGEPTLASYRDRLAKDAAERKALMRSLLIPVTEFFRDPPAWDALRDHVLPTLAERARAGRSVRIWCAGCASGEEAYTIAILVAEGIPDRGGVEILATDLDPSAIRSAKEATYDPARMEEVSPERRKRFFRPVEGAFRVAEELRDAVRFEVHDLTREPPPGAFDLIVCRNLLIYFDEELQARVLAGFHDALTQGGVLLLGKSEAIPGHSARFDVLSRPMRVFRVNGKAEERPEGPADVRLVDPPLAEVFDAVARSPMRLERSDAFVLALDASWRIVTANPRAGELFGRDVVGSLLLDAFPAWQGSPVHDALRAVAATGRGSKVRGAPTPWGPIDLTIEALPDASRGMLLVGTPAESRLPWRARSEPTDDVRVQEARADLAATNDELQSTNEELAATNEELQAANEELASLNEEFQSTNQTLGSRNDELQATATSAQPGHDLMTEILMDRPEAIVALDPAKRVTFFNERARDLFGLDRSSLGRHLAIDGISAPELDERLARAASGEVEHAFDHQTGKLVALVKRLATREGRLLGWVLTWTAHR